MKMGSPSPNELFSRLHPRLADWFRATYSTFTDAQLRCVPAILDRESILLTSPTGSGKTLAGFLGVFDFLLRKIDRRRAHGQACNASMSRRCARSPTTSGRTCRRRSPAWAWKRNCSIHLRTGDTPAANAQSFARNRAHFLVTTPESLAVMLAQENYAAHLRDCPIRHRRRTAFLRRQ